MNIFPAQTPRRGLSPAKPRLPRLFRILRSHDPALRRCAPHGSAWAGGVVVVAVLALAVPALADEPTLDELLDLETTPSEAEPADPDADEPAEAPADEPTTPDATEVPSEAELPGLDLDEDVRRMLRGDEAADAFEEAVRQMDGVARRLGDLDPGLATQREQESILAKLDQVIAAARQQQMSPQSDGGGEGDGDQQQARDQDAGAEDLAQQARDAQAGDAEAQAAGEAGGTTEAGDDASPGSVVDAEQDDGPLEELRREWGQLPPRLRDEISEGLQERFSPTYRSMTEAYYRRLAEEE